MAATVDSAKQRALIRVLRRRCSLRLIVIALLTCHAALLAWSAYTHSPVINEVGHLPAGISHWQFGRFDLYRVNPPLVRMVAALPVLLASPATNWSSYTTDPLVRAENAVGEDFVNANGFRSFWLYTLGRWACIPFSLLGGFVCFRWAADLYGHASGILALALWCFCPNILGHGALMMPDVPAAALGVTACYAFWHWLERPDWTNGLLCGIALGLAELTKTTMLILFPLWPVMWCAYRFGRRKDRSNDARWCREGAMLVVQIVLAVMVLNLGYGCEGSFKQLSQYSFQSHAMTGRAHADVHGAGGNRFAESWLGAIAVPLPKNYVQGIDAQRLDFERGLPSYLNGTWQDHGWWYFYLYALAVKVPIGTWFLLALATFLTVLRRGYSGDWRDEGSVVLPAAAIIGLVSSQDGFSIHFRYILPALPFLFVWGSKVARAFSFPERPVAWLVCLATSCSVASSLFIYPHSLSYFNELFGGPARGHYHLLDSNAAWGQDILYLKQWYDANPNARPFYLASIGRIDPRLAGITFQLPPLGRATDRELGGDEGSMAGSGWYAIDVNHLHGSHLLAPTGTGNYARMNQRGANLRRFLSLTPVSRIGWSIQIYHISPAEARDIRSPLGLHATDSARD